jgi:SAM-dependent methyltransferase
LTPELIERAKENAALMKVEATFQQGDAEAIPLPDAKFDFVVSQFGHMFAPQPEVVIKEMLRVLKPGGRIAFSTWPPDLLVGRNFALMGKYAPPPPPGVSPPSQWGNTATVRERLGSAVKDIEFSHDTLFVQALSPAHLRVFMETNFGPAKKLMASLDASDPAKAAAVRREMEELNAVYFADNHVRQDFLMTRATKV